MLKSFSRPVLPAPYVRQLGVRFRGNGAPCRILADRVETLVAAAPAISIRLDVLSEFSEPGIRLEKDLSNAVTLDNVLDLIR